MLIFSSACLKLDERGAESGESGKEKNETKPINFDLGGIKPANFMEGFEVIKQIDAHYGANFKKEFVGGPIVKLPKIEPMISDLEKLRKIIDPNMRQPEEIMEIDAAEKNEMALLALLIDARIQMLKAEQNVHLAYSFGAEGLVGDGYSCREKEKVYKSLDYFENTYIEGKKAWLYMDAVLSGNPKSESFSLIRGLVGVDEGRPAFYLSPLGHIHQQVEADKKSVDKNCKNEGPDSKVYVSYEKSKNWNMLLDITKFQEVLRSYRKEAAGIENGGK